MRGCCSSEEMLDKAIAAAERGENKSGPVNSNWVCVPTLLVAVGGTPNGSMVVVVPMFSPKTVAKNAKDKDPTPDVLAGTRAGAAFLMSACDCFFVWVLGSVNLLSVPPSQVSSSPRYTTYR